MKIKKLLALVLTLAMVISLLVMPASAVELSDVSGHWAEDSIQRWVDGGILKGYNDGSFKANNPIKRAEFAHILVQTLGLTGTTTTTFNDVPDDHWAKDSIYICAANGIVNGKGDGRFAPDDYITRLEAMKMFVVAMQMDGGFTDEEAKTFLAEVFTDAGDIKWGHAYAATMVGYGAMQGSGDKLNPVKNITRGETATILDRLLAVYVSKDGVISTTTQDQIDNKMMCNIVVVHPDASAEIVTGEEGEITVTVGETVVETATLDGWTPYVLCGSEGGYAYNSVVTVDKGTVDQKWYYLHDLIVKEVEYSYEVDWETEEEIVLTTTTEYEYDEDIWQVVKFTRESDYEDEPIVLTAEYDGDGNLTKVYKNDQVAGEFVYENGKLVKETSYWDGVATRFITYTYNEAGLLTEVLKEDTQMVLGKEVYEYDANGNEIAYRYYSSENLNLMRDRITTYDENGKILTIETGEYQSSGDTIEIVYYKCLDTYKNGKLISSKETRDGGRVDETLYEYNERGQRTLETWYMDGELMEKVSYAYDEEGQRISTICVDAEEKEIWKYLYTSEERDNGYFDRQEYYEEGELLSAYEYEADWDTNEYWSREYQLIGSIAEDGTEVFELKLISEYYSVGKEVDGMWVETYEQDSDWGKWDGENTYMRVNLPDDYERQNWFWDFT